MIIDFSPSPKIVAKMEHIYKLREQGVYWVVVAKIIGNKKRYTQALYKYYREEILAKETK